ncbi:histidine--tRNA ligase [Serratia sp. Se-RSBMAAmG]|uniref:histidine--tRNA ligase n=1 Tax=Serratia sp. Se-RSBMAAmG TaxID=3043305 RepID=UPI0024AFDEC0|nr:histidine--tRNA ligase [Serratia sp. Se-RSBMAAmG]MDI6976680.1 histidine--tRNA ligase [Serratia sp. Se-RSBMAAmG]
MSKKSFKPQSGYPENVNAKQTYAIDSICREWAEKINAVPVLLPMVESKSLFERGVGEGTDVVDKEMLQLISKEDVVLRPEGTAGAIRAWNNQGGRNTGPQKWFYSGYMFRNERQQAGRYKQFQQFGLELIGFKEGVADAELLVDLDNLFIMLSIREKVSLKLNNIGTKEERELYSKALVEWLMPYKDQLDEQSQLRLSKNPLRILDSKDEKTKEIIKASPKIDSFLGEETKKTWGSIISVLDAMGIAYEVDNSLMRGLDYYNGLVFEWVMNDEDKAQNAVAAGGRYDGLSSAIGGEPVPALGFALGIERVAILQNEITVPPERKGVYICWMGDVLDYAFLVRKKIMGENNIVMIDDGAKNLSKQIKKANEKMYEKVVIIGESEKETATFTLKDLISGEQKLIYL